MNIKILFLVTHFFLLNVKGCTVDIILGLQVLGGTFGLLSNKQLAIFIDHLLYARTLNSSFNSSI